MKEKGARSLEPRPFSSIQIQARKRHSEGDEHAVMAATVQRTVTSQLAGVPNASAIP